MTKEEQVLEKHFLDLANAVYQKGFPLYSDFLSLYEQDLFFNMKKKLPPVYTIISGGNSFVERKIIAFFPDEDMLDPLPISVLEVKPVNEKFAQELSHRDYLGALINLGIERSVLGDIIVAEKTAYVFCKSSMADYIIKNLFLVKHTNVSCQMTLKSPQELSPKFEDIKGSVAAPRLDSALAVAFHGSRSSLSGLIEGKKVFVNSRLVDSNSYLLKEGDIVSVRGYGKFIYQKILGTTKKGRIYINLKKYI